MPKAVSMLVGGLRGIGILERLPAWVCEAFLAANSLFCFRAMRIVHVHGGMIQICLADQEQGGGGGACQRCG